MNDTMKKLFFLIAASFFLTSVDAQITERERPAEWQHLVKGARFMDRFLPMPDGIQIKGIWGTDSVLNRYVDNGIELPGVSFWGGNILQDTEKDKLASIDINKIDNDIFDLEKRPYFMGRFQDEGDMLSLFFYDGYEEVGKKLIYNDMYYYNIGLNSVMYYNGGTWIKGNNLNIVDDLNSTVPGSVLDANQGRILKGLIDNITTMLNSDESNLDTLQEIVDFIKINRDTLNALTIGSISGLVDKLDTKVDKVSGKGLSSNDYTNIEKTAVSTIGDKQDKLISGSNIKTINNISLLGNGNIEISNTGGGHNVNTDVYSGRYGIIWDYASDTCISTTTYTNTSI
jgi:hypothetical protein